MAKPNPSDKNSTQIQNIFVGPQMVTRSKARLFRSFGVRNMFVAIEPNFRAICLQWLYQPAEPAEPVEANIANKANPMKRRRASFAGGNLFSVSSVSGEVGEIEEMGFDYLHRLPKPGDANLNDSKQQDLNQYENEMDVDPDDSVLIMPEAMQEDEEEHSKVFLERVQKENQAEIDPNLLQSLRPYLRIGPMGKRATTAVETAEAKQAEINRAIDGNDSGVNATSSTHPAEPRILYDPFRRSKNLPFAITGRRRSVHVMTTIKETDNFE